MEMAKKRPGSLIESLIDRYETSVGWFNRRTMLGLEQSGKHRVAFRYARFAAFFREKVCDHRLPVYYARFNRREDMRRWLDRKLKNPLYQDATRLARKKSPQSHLAALFRADDYFGSASAWRLQLLKNLRDACFAGQSEDFNKLFRLALWTRIVPSAESDSLIKGKILPRGLLLDYYTVIERCRDIRHAVNRAAENQTAEPGAMKALQGTANGKRPAVDIFIPPHFFAGWDDKKGGRRAQNWQNIRDIYSQLLTHLGGETAFDTVPRHQMFISTPVAAQNNVAFSFFTKRGKVRNWHIRDIGFEQKVSIDPDGYWGVSSLSKPETDIRRQLMDLDISAEEAETARLEMLAFLQSSGGDKYQARQSPTSFDGDYIFCPLQSPPGLEAHNGTVEQLIDQLAAFSQETGMRVIFKKHPLCESPTVRKKLAEACAKGCETSSDSTWALVEKAKAVVTINSAVALQAVVAHRPLVLWGQADVQSISLYARDVDGLKAALNAALEPFAAQALYDRFCWFYWRRYLVDANDRAAVLQRMRLALDAARLDDKAAVRKLFLNKLFEDARS